jgi:hypothetical protein
MTGFSHPLSSICITIKNHHNGRYDMQQFMMVCDSPQQRSVTALTDRTHLKNSLYRAIIALSFS